MFCFWKKSKCSKGKDVAKFLAGASAVTAINNATFLSGGNFPLVFSGFTITKTAAIFGVVSGIIVFVISVYYAWIRKD